MHTCVGVCVCVCLDEVVDSQHFFLIYNFSWAVAFSTCCFRFSTTKRCLRGSSELIDHVQEGLVSDLLPQDQRGRVLF